MYFSQPDLQLQQMTFYFWFGKERWGQFLHWPRTWLASLWCLKNKIRTNDAKRTLWHGCPLLERKPSLVHLYTFLRIDLFLPANHCFWNAHIQRRPLQFRSVNEPNHCTQPNSIFIDHLTSIPYAENHSAKPSLFAKRKQKKRMKRKWDKNPKHSLNQRICTWHCSLTSCTFTLVCRRGSIIHDNNHWRSLNKWHSDIIRTLPMVFPKLFLFCFNIYWVVMPLWCAGVHIFSGQHIFLMATKYWGGWTMKFTSL